MVQTQSTFTPFSFIYSSCTTTVTLQHNEIKCFSLGRFYEGKCDLIHFHINIFYGRCWVFLPVRQTRSWVVEQCFMARRRFSLLSLACQTLGPPHSWLSPQWNSIRRSHYSDIVKLGFPSLPTYPDTMIQPPFFLHWLAIPTFTPPFLTVPTSFFKI